MKSRKSAHRKAKRECLFPNFQLGRKVTKTNWKAKSWESMTERKDAGLPGSMTTTGVLVISVETWWTFAANIADSSMLTLKRSVKAIWIVDVHVRLRIFIRCVRIRIFLFGFVVASVKHFIRWSSIQKYDLSDIGIRGFGRFKTVPILHTYCYLPCYHMLENILCLNISINKLRPRPYDRRFSTRITLTCDGL